MLVYQQNTTTKKKKTWDPQIPAFSYQKKGIILAGFWDVTPTPWSLTNRKSGKSEKRWKPDLQCLEPKKPYGKNRGKDWDPT